MANAALPRSTNKSMTKQVKQKQVKPAKSKNKPKGAIIGLIIMGIVIVILAIGALVYSRYQQVKTDFTGKFFSGTTINGIDAGGLNVDEVEAKIAESIDDFNLAVKFREDKTETITGADIDYHYESDGSVQRMMDARTDGDYLKAALTGGKVSTTVTVGNEAVYDKDKLNAVIAALPELQDENMVPPSDAHLEYQENKFVVVPESAGTQLNKDLVIEAITKAAEDTESEIDITTLEGAYSSPTVLAADVGEQLQAQADQLNTYTTASITYQLLGGDQVLDGNTTKDWLSVDENGNYYKDDAVWNQHIQDYVSALAERVNSIGSTRPFNATGIGRIEVSGGSYGNLLNGEKEIAQLTEELNTGAVVTRQPNYTYWDVSLDNDGFGNTYVEIDLSRQHLWIYTDGQLSLETDIVSGTMDEGNYTPPGVFLLQNKQQNAILRGKKDPETGKYEYESPVKYWMPFNGGIGLHDADWKWAFGGTEYLYNGSHGCINLPPEVAGQVYDLVHYEMPIIVYYSQPYELRPSSDGSQQIVNATGIANE